MLDIAAIVVCPATFLAVLAATFLLGRSLSGTALAAVLAGTGAFALVLSLPSLLPVLLADSGARSPSPLATCTATALGLASLAGAWIAARILPRG